MADRYEHVWAAAAPYLRARKNDVHVPLSYGYARTLLAEHPDADPDVVLPAVILHDTGWAVVEHRTEQVGPDMLKSDMRRAHEIEGARIAREITGNEEIATIIDGHDTRLHALSRNDELVKDADKLWRYCVAGVGIGCDFFGMTPGEYADHVEAELEDVLFTDTALRIARREIAETREALRL
ncbi:MAG TPA: HD domain-containing protein [Solirubrobacter sp.]|nr:HD domain-containing protein [Solirubrobacter sp.]